MALPSGNPDPSRPTGQPAAPRLPFGPPSRRNPASATNLASQGVPDWFYGGKDAVRNEAIADSAWQDAQNTAFEREERFAKDRVAQDKQVAEDLRKQRDAQAERDLASAELGLSQAPSTLTESQRRSAEEKLAEKRKEAKRTATGALQAEIQSDAEFGKTTGWFSSEPTDKAKDLQERLERLQAGELDDSTFEEYRKAHPETFAELSGLEKQIQTDDEARKAREPAARSVARAKAIKSGLSPEEADAVLDREKAPAADPAVFGMERVAASGVLEREQQRIADLTGRVQKRQVELQQVDTDLADVEAQLARGGTIAAMRPLMERREELRNIRASTLQQAAAESEALQGASRALEIRQQRERELSERMKRTQEAAAPETGYRAPKDFTKATPEIRAARKADAEKIIGVVSERAKARAAAEQEAAEKVEMQVRAGKITPEVGARQREQAIEQARAAFEEDAIADQRILDDHIRDYDAGIIDAETLNAVAHAAGMPESGVELFRQRKADLDAFAGHVEAAQAVMLGDSDGRDNPLLNGEELALLNQIATVERAARNPEAFKETLQKSVNTDEMGRPVGLVNVTDADLAEYAKGKTQEASALKTKLATLRQEQRAKLADALAKRGITDPAEQAGIIVEAEMAAIEKARPGVAATVAARGGIASATAEKLPFVGGAFEAVRILPYAATALKMERGETPAPEELEALSAFVRFSGSDPTFWNKVTETVTMLPGFATELYLTGGVATAVREGGNALLKSALQRAASAQGKEKLASMIARSSVENVASAWGKNNAKKALAYRIGSGFAQEAVRLPLASASRIAAGFTRETAMEGVNLSPVEGKLVATMNTDERRGTLGRVADAVVDSYIENLSERSGAYALGALGKVTPRVAKDALAKMSNAAKGSVLSAAFVKALIAKNPGIEPLKLQRFLKGANIGGTFEEMLEERVGAAARDVYKGVTTWEWKPTLPTGEDLAVEFVSFLVPGAASAVSTNRHFRKLDQSLQESDAESTARINELDTDPQAQALRLSELAGVPINAAEITAAVDLVGNIATTDRIRGSDKTQEEYLNRANAAVEAGDLNKASQFMQMALRQSRTRGSIADGEMLRAVAAAREIAGARTALKQQAADLRTQAQADLAANPKDKATQQRAQQIEAQALQMETAADTAAALVKIARGRDDALTTAEKNAIGDAVVNEGQGLIITDAARDLLAEISPAAASYVRQTETMRREQLSRDTAAAAGATAPPAATGQPAASAPSGGSSPQAGGAPTATGAATAQGPAAAPPASASPAAATPPASQAGGAGGVSGKPGAKQKASVPPPPSPILTAATTEAEIDKEIAMRRNLADTMDFGATDNAKLEADIKALEKEKATRFGGKPTSGKPGVWKGVGVSGKTAEIPADEAATQEEAEKKLIKKLGEPLRSGGVTPPKGNKGTSNAKPAAAASSSPAPAGNPQAEKAKAHQSAVNQLVRSVLPAYRGAFSGVELAKGKTRRAWYDPNTGKLHLNLIEFAKQTADLEGDALRTEIETIIRHEWIHAGTVKVRNAAEAAAFWQSLGKSKAGRDLQQAALRAYNATYEATGQTPPALSDQQAGYEAYRMFTEMALDGRLSETTNIPDGLAGEIRAFLERLVEWMRAQIAKLPKEQKAAIDADVALIESALQQITPDAPTARAPKPAPAPVPVAEGDADGLTIVSLKDGRMVHVRTRELEMTDRPRLRMFSPEGEPIKGNAGVLERTDIAMSPIGESGSPAAANSGAATPPGGSIPGVAGEESTSDAEKSTVDEAAHEAATSPENDKPEPTPAQKEAGNYEKGHVRIGGMDISIENPAGSTRSGTDGKGKPWSIEMRHHYGYIKGTEGKDGDHIDIFIEPGTPEDYAGPVFVVNQTTADGKTFDEHKAVMGPNITTLEQARAAYLANYSEGWKGDGSIARFNSVDEFKKWAMASQRRTPAQTASMQRDRDTFGYTRMMGVYMDETPESSETVDGILYELFTGSGKAVTRMTDIDSGKVVEGSLVLHPTVDGGRSAHANNVAKARVVAKPTDQAPELPQFARGDRVAWTSGKESLTGTVRSVSSDGTASIDTDQIMTAGGVPIGRIETVSLRSLKKVDSPARDAVDDALAQAFDGLYAADRPSDSVVDALSALAQNDELFRFPIVRWSRHVPSIMEQVYPGSKFEGDATREDEQAESGADIRLMFRTPNGKEFYVYLTKSEVWIDVSRLEEGDGGAAVYAAVGNYAFNAKKTFVGDPAGLSEAATIRRTSNMLSLALRFGTTNHIEPSDEQRRGDAEKGIAPLRWEGNDDTRIRSLIESFLATIHHRYPEIRNARYDFDAGLFLDGTGMPIRFDRAQGTLQRGGDRRGQSDAEDSKARGARAGESTLRRAILLQSLVSQQASGAGAGLLEQIQLWNREYVKAGGLDALFSADRPILKQEDLPKDRRASMLNAAGVFIDAGLKTPEELAQRLDKLAPNGALRKYSRSFWRLITGFDSTLPENPDWPAIYSALDGAAAEETDLDTEAPAGENAGDETAPDIRPEGEAGLPPRGRPESSGELRTPEADSGSPGTRQPDGDETSAGSGDSPGMVQPDGGRGDSTNEDPAAGGTPEGRGEASTDRPPAGDAGGRGNLDRPQHSPGRSNYHLTDPEAIVGGGPKARFRKNQQALNVLERLESEDRDPTPEELDALAAYTGWGALGQEMFKGSFENYTGPEEWREEAMWLRDRLGKADWTAAQDSIINAHYTDPPTVAAMWDMVRRMGFAGGRVLEPSIGIGNFYSLMPRDLMAASQLTGIEMDPTTAAIAKILHPQANIRVMPYQNSTTSDNFYDLVIGNWPFSNNDFPADRRFDHLKAPVHDFFFIKALAQTRPGGLVIGITSAGSMDKKNSRVRKYLAARGELVAAYRLPAGAFGKYAGTKVVTDIIILRKRQEELKEDAGNEGWVESKKHPDFDFHINEYYLNNPSHILGRLDFGHGTTSGRPGMIVHRPDDFEAVLPKLFERLPEGIMTPWTGDNMRDRIIKNTTSEIRQNTVVEQGNDLYIVDGENLVPLESRAKWRTKDAEKRLQEARGLIAIRSAFVELMGAYQKRTDTEAPRTKLREAYVAFVKDHKGGILKSRMAEIFKKAGDPYAADLFALVDIQDGKEVPRAIMSKDIMRLPTLDATGSIADAYAVHRSENAHFDAEGIAKLAGEGVTAEQVIEFLSENGSIYKTPTGFWEPGEIYLSGNVRRKLREAEAAKDEGVEGLEPSIEALRKIVPQDVPYYQITVQMGAPWIPVDDYRTFVAGILNGKKEDVEIIKASSGYNVRIKGATAGTTEARNTYNVVSEWGEDMLHPSQIIQAAMNGTALQVSVTVKDPDGSKRTVVDEPMSKKAVALRDRIRNEFNLWLWQDEGRAARISFEYNEVMNSIVNTQHDGRHLRLPGLALSIGGNGPFDLRQHQLNAIWRGILQGKGMYAHEVGTGKTFTMAGIAIEGRRMGSHRKPLIFAHNANSEAVASDFRRAYPGARVLYIDSLEPAKQAEKLRQIATDEWDAVIVPHSLIGKFGLKADTLRAMAREQIEQLENEFWETVEDAGLENVTPDMLDDPKAMAIAIKFARGDSLAKRTAKELVNARRRIISRVEKQIAKFSAPGTVFFEDLGVDSILVDEAHIFKKISLATRKVIKGLNKAESGPGFQLGMLTDWVKEQNNGKGVHLFTGTPVTNTLNEVYNMMRFVMHDEMPSAQIENFDDWFNNFATGVTDIEPTSGGTWEAVERLRGFVNIPELARLAGQVFDVVRAKDMPEFMPRDSDEGFTENPQGRPRKVVRPIVIEPPQVQKRVMRWIRQRFAYYRSLSGKGRMAMQKGGGDVPLLMDNDGKNAALDPRLVNPTAEDDPSSKVNSAVARIVEHYDESDKATQMVFLDRGANDMTVAEVPIRGVFDNDGKQVTRPQKRRQFNVIRDMVEKLVAQGVKPEEIAVFHNMTLLPLEDGREDVLKKVHRISAKTSKEDIAKMMNEGKIRVAFGGTETMGTGVNAQTWLRAMHHLDVPWMPGELEQRNGRGHRQGNKWNTVYEYRYTVEGTHDGKMWSTLLNKVRFIERFIEMLQGKGVTRTMEGDGADTSEGGSGSVAEFEQMFSSAAGDPRILLRTKLEKDLEKIRTDKQIHLSFIEQSRRKVDQLQRKIPDTEAEATRLEADYARFKEWSEAGFKVELRGKEYTERAEFDEALKRLPKFRERTSIGSFGGFFLHAHTSSMGQDYFTISSPDSLGWGQSHEFTTASAASMEGKLRGLTKRAATLREEVETSKASVERLRGELNKPFPREEELKNMEEAYQRLRLEIISSPTPAPGWLRHGAPSGSLIYVREDGNLVPKDVQAHRWDDNGYWILIDKGGELTPIRYNEALTEEGSRMFEDQEFTEPPVIPAAQEEGISGGTQAVGIENSLHEEFGFRLVITPEGETVRVDRFEIPYHLVEDGFYDRPAGTWNDDPENAPKTQKEMRDFIAFALENGDRKLAEQWEITPPNAQGDEGSAFANDWKITPRNSATGVAGATLWKALKTLRDHPVYGESVTASTITMSWGALARWRDGQKRFPADLGMLFDVPRKARGLYRQREKLRAMLERLEIRNEENDKENVRIENVRERLAKVEAELLEQEKDGGIVLGAADRISAPPWSGVIDLRDNKVEKTFSYQKAAEYDFHHSHLVTPSQLRRIQDGEADYFWLEDGEPKSMRGLPASAVAAIKKQLGPKLKSAASSADDAAYLAAADRPTEDDDFRAALDELAADLPDDAALADLRERAGIAWGREYSDAELADAAFGMRAGLRTSYDAKLDRQTHEEWNEAARQLVDRDPAAVVRDLVSTATDRGAIINPVQVKATQIVIPQLMREAIANRSPQAFRDAAALTWAYDIAGTETARGLAARWQPHLSPEERHREALAKAIFTPGFEDRKRIKGAPSPKGKADRIKFLEAEIERVRTEALEREKNLLAQASAMTASLRETRRKDAMQAREQAKRELDKLRGELKRTRDQKDQIEMLNEANKARLEQIENAFEEMGVTFYDLFVSRDIVFGLRTSSMVKNAMQPFTPKERQAIQMMLDGRSDRQISNKTGISRSRVPELEARFDKILDARLEDLVRRGFDVTKAEGLDVDQLIDKNGNILGAANRADGAALTADEIKKRVAELRKLIKPAPDARNSGALKRLKGEASKEAPYGFDISRPEHAAMLMRAIQRLDSTATDMVYEYWINGLLSGPATHSANIAGNIGNAALEYLVQRPAEAITNAVLFRNVAGASLGEYRSMAKYVSRASALALRFANIAWRTEISLFDAQWLNEPIQIKGNSGDKGQVQRFAIGGQTGRIVRTPSRFLQWADEWAKHFFGTLEASAQAHRLALADGLKPGTAAFDDRVEQLVGTPGSPAWLAAVDKAHRLTFTQELPGPLHKAQTLLHERAETALGAFVKTALRFLFPFVRTPYNIFATGLRKTPLGTARMAWKGIAAWKDGKPFFDSYPQAAIAGDLAEQLIGWAVATVLYGAAEGDPDDEKKLLLFTGTRSRSDDRGEDQLLDRTRGGETTILVNGKPIFHYGRYEPFATVITTIVDAARDLKKIKGGQTSGKAIEQAFRNVIDQARTKTFLQGFDGLMQLIEGRTSTTPAEALRKFIVTGIVPNLVRQPLRNADEYARDTRNAPWYYHAIPVGGLAEPLYDLYGNPVKKGGNPASRMLFSSPTEPAPRNPADTALQAWGATHPLRGEGDGMAYFPTNPSKTMFRYKDALGNWQDMTPREIAELRRRGGQRMAAKAREAVTTPAAPTQEDINRIKKARGSAFSDTKKEMFPGGAKPVLPVRRPPSLKEIFGQVIRR